MILIKILEVVCLTLPFVSGMGDVHTSMETIARLVTAEDSIIKTLKAYIGEEEHRIQTIKQYVDTWPGDTSELQGFVDNPLNSYHFLRRITEDFQSVELALHNNQINNVQHQLDRIRKNVHKPGEIDVNGAAWALVRLQDTYNLTLDDLVSGHIRDTIAVTHLTADDCFRFGQQSFQNLEFDLSNQWMYKGIELLESQGPLTQATQKRIDNIYHIINSRVAMKEFVTDVAKKSDESLLDRFSGLGIPASFQKKIYEDRGGFAQIDKLEELYRQLCRGEPVQHPDATTGLKCGYIYGKSLYHLIMPYKAELLWSDPIIMIYHDVLSKSETKLLKDIAVHRLKKTQVHSFTSHEAKTSIARVGKTAWISRGDSDGVDTILERVDDMTGLTTSSSEDMHVLNYGIGGHYDNHVDFFDLRSKNLDASPHKGDRLATILFYLNDVSAGGATVFPTLGVRSEPREGSALFWFNLKRNGDGDYRTVHASCPVLLGQKWIANLWLHEWEQEFRWPCTLNSEE